MTGKPSGGLVRAAPFLALFAVVVCHLDSVRACTPAVIWCPHEDYESILQKYSLWGAYRVVLSNPLHKLNSEYFLGGLVELNVTEPAIIAEELCVEDLRNSKVLSNAVNGSKIIYFPCVITPDVVYRKIYRIYEIKTIEDMNDDHELNMALKDIDSNSCIAITGKQCRYSYAERIKREAVADNSTEFKIKTDRIILYSAKPLLFRASDKSEHVELVQSKVSGASSRSTKDEKTVILAIKFAGVENIGDMTLEFFFQIKSVGYYTLNRVNYETSNNGELFTRRDISFPFNFSYHCTPKTVFSGNGSAYLSISDMQVQVDPKNVTFSDAYDCVGFTSIPIWTGIFVTAILGMIMIWALTMIMDIRTMDRFDDPKGKTITISSAE
ncbi:uncharacterized protein LOC112461381 [Temnothorax curvispinosus]|uniref:Uncharacterized protein LOC112461261 n=1 Tax=Temnothorax curvispinosus TaxID=300111 RepID=A0A6J1QPB1_9HYME|nr:uncharacterized protein LOC112461261 [Temnothorax curvispinosus]XP_024882375.1 uncharacterized protein LOC112461381 [Temnothorax curvispinosus]